jgi:hypothetical protein
MLRLVALTEMELVLLKPQEDGREGDGKMRGRASMQLSSSAMMLSDIRIQSKDYFGTSVPE